MNKNEIEKEFDEIMKPPKFLPEYEGKDCPMCGHPMPNSKGTEVLKDFLFSTITQILQEILPEERETLNNMDFFNCGYNSAISEMKEKVKKLGF